MVLKIEDQSQKNSALLQACVEGTIQEVEELLNAGANLDAEDRLGSTAFNYALTLFKFDIAEKLLQLGCEVRKRGRYRDAPFPSTLVLSDKYKGMPEELKRLILEKDHTAFEEFDVKYLAHLYSLKGKSDFEDNITKFEGFSSGNLVFNAYKSEAIESYRQIKEIARYWKVSGINLARLRKQLSRPLKR